MFVGNKTNEMKKITLNIDLTTPIEKEPFDPENIEETIEQIGFDDFESMFVYVMCELNAFDEKVYVLAYDSIEEGVVFVDHVTGNVLSNIDTQLKPIYENGIVDSVYLFACDNYNDAYDLALDMKEQTGMLKWQLEYDEVKEDPTISNGGIEVSSLKN